MNRKTISIPISIELTNENSWMKLNDDETSFFVIRFHFQLNGRIINEKHKVGNWLGLYQSPKGMSAQHTTSETSTVEQISSTESIENYILDNELFTEIAFDLAQSTDLKILKIDDSLKSTISNKLKTSLSKNTKILDSQKVIQTKTIEITNHYSADETKAIVSVPVYRKKSFDITLSFIDYLTVNYQRTTFGLRKKSIKFPKIDNRNNHKNIIKIDIPIATMYYWELQDKASKFMYEDEHKVEVENPTEIIIGGAIHTNNRYLEFPNIPSLYQISNVTFPHKWIWRKPENKKWTETELKDIELEEVKLNNYGWYSRHYKD